MLTVKCEIEILLDTNNLQYMYNQPNQVPKAPHEIERKHYLGEITQRPHHI